MRSHSGWHCKEPGASLKRRLAACACVAFLQSASAVSRPRLIRDARIATPRLELDVINATDQHVDLVVQGETSRIVGGLAVSHSEEKVAPEIPASASYEEDSLSKSYPFPESTNFSDQGAYDQLKTQTNKSAAFQMGTNDDAQTAATGRQSLSVYPEPKDPIQESQELQKTVQAVGPDGAIASLEAQQAAISETREAQPITQILPDGEAQTLVAQSTLGSSSHASLHQSNVKHVPLARRSSLPAESTLKTNRSQESTFAAPSPQTPETTGPVSMPAAGSQGSAAPESNTSILGTFGNIVFFCIFVVCVALFSYWMGQRRAFRSIALRPADSDQLRPRRPYRHSCSDPAADSTRYSARKSSKRDLSSDRSDNSASSHNGAQNNATVGSHLKRLGIGNEDEQSSGIDEQSSAPETFQKGLLQIPKLRD